MARLVLDRHRPTLGELAAPIPRWARAIVVVLGVLVVVGLLVSRLASGEAADVYVNRDEPQFNLAYGERLALREPTEPAGLMALEERRGPLFVQSFVVRGLELPAYEGDVGGIMPLFAEREIAGLTRRFAQFELMSEGKARINEVGGYEIAFRARLGKRRLYGKVVLLPEPVPGSRQAVALEMLGTPVSGVGNAADVGTNAVLKQPLRSFRFGTERP